MKFSKFVKMLKFVWPFWGYEPIQLTTVCVWLSSSNLDWCL